MAWVTKDSTETYNQTPEPPREYTKKEKAANWWHYHWMAVVVAVLVVMFGVWIIKDTVFQTRPDVQVAYVGTSDLPTDTVTALQDALTPFCSDLNGDGKVVVQVDSYTVDFDAANESTDAYYQMAGVTRLSAELSSGGKTYIFLLEDPEGFEAQTGALQYLDGTVPDDPETTDADWREMVYRWTDCPVLTGLDLGSYEGLTLMDDVTGTNQSVLAHLYVGRRGVWDEKQVPTYEGCAELWDTLTAGAVSTAAHADALRALAGPGGLPLLPCLHPALEEGQIVGDYAGQDELQAAAALLPLYAEDPLPTSLRAAGYGADGQGAVLTPPILREDYTQLRHFLRLALRWATERYASYHVWAVLPLDLEHPEACDDLCAQYLSAGLTLRGMRPMAGADQMLIFSAHGLVQWRDPLRRCHLADPALPRVLERGYAAADFGWGKNGLELVLRPV